MPDGHCHCFEQHRPLHCFEQHGGQRRARRAAAQVHDLPAPSRATCNRRRVPLRARVLVSKVEAFILAAMHTSTAVVWRPPAPTAACLAADGQPYPLPHCSAAWSAYANGAARGASPAVPCAKQRSSTLCTTASSRCGQPQFSAWCRHGWVVAGGPGTGRHRQTKPLATPCCPALQEVPPPDRLEEEGPDLNCLDHAYFRAESDRLLCRWGQGLGQRLGRGLGQA